MRALTAFKKKKLLTALLLPLIVFGIWHFFKKDHSQESAAQASIFVEAEKVQLGSISLEEKVIGTIVAAQSVQITPEVSGQVEKILVNDGALVQMNTPIIQLDDSVNRAKAESAKANLVYSEENYKRMELLVKRGVVSRQAVDQAIADVKEKRALEKESRVLAEKMLITAPFNGVLGKINVSPGQHVAVGESLVFLTDIQNLRAEFNISEKYLPRLKIGQQVTLTTSTFPGKKFYGKVSYIAPTINTEDRTISVYADVPNQDHTLTSGLYVNVNHLMGEEKNILFIPAVSLVATIDGQSVYKIVNGKAVSTPVKVGHRTDDQAQIIEGLEKNDMVIVSGQHKVKDGTPIQLKA